MKLSETLKLILLSAVVLLVVYAGIQTWREQDLQKKYLRLHGKLQAQLETHKELETMLAKKSEAWEAERKEAIKAQESLREKIGRIEKEKALTSKALEEEKRKTEALPPSDLALEIDETVGPEVSLQATGLLTFTLPAARRAMNLFVERNYFISLYQQSEDQIAYYEKSVEAFNQALMASENERAALEAGWQSCKKALMTSLQVNTYSEKKAKAGLWRARIEGAAGGIAATVIAGKIFRVF